MTTIFKYGDKVVYVTDLNKNESKPEFTIQEVLPCVNEEQEYLIKGEYGNVKRAFQSQLILVGAPFDEVLPAPKEFVKHDQGKPAAHLLPPVALLEVAKVLSFGAKKYKEHGWRTVDKRSRYAAAVQRHLLAYQSGEDLDPESGLPHLAHLACSALFLLESQILGLGEDDRHGKRNL